MEDLAQYGLGGATVALIAAWLLKKLREFILAGRAKVRIETSEPPEDLDEILPPTEAALVARPEPVTPPPAPPAPPPVNAVEDYYRQWKRSLPDADREVQLAVQKAQFLATKKNKPQLLTLYDPSDVPPGTPLTRLEDFPLDDSRRKPTADHPAAGECGDVVVLDFRPLADELNAGFLPAPFRERYAAMVARRQAAITAGAVKTARWEPAGITTILDVESTDAKLQLDIQKHKAYRAKIETEVKADLERLLPDIRTSAEKMAREVFVPSRLDALRAEANEKGVPVEELIDAFVASVGEAAVRGTEDRVRRGGPLTAANALLSGHLTGERMAAGNMWQF